MTDFLDLAWRLALALGIGAAIGVGSFRLHKAMLEREDRVRTGRRDDGGWWV